ncbi:MAG: hypothetical protein J7577_15275 [Sphingobacteriaceae bacterium]|nr:hypothetical protein [Sphingobacteriaceae bacterium]
MKNHIPKLLSVLIFVLIAHVSFASRTGGKTNPFQTSYKKRNNAGFSIINHTGVDFVSVTISGLDINGNAQTQTIQGIANGNSDYFDFYSYGALHSVSVTIVTSSPSVYAFDVRTQLYSHIYSTINYNVNPKTFYIPDNENEEIIIECYSENY